ENFLSFALAEVASAERLAIELAKRTRFMRDIVVTLAQEEPAAAVKLLGFFEAFRSYLIAGLTLPDFADLYAQTITYGLFAARSRVSGKFTRRGAFDAIPRTIGILRDIFRFVSLEDLPKALEWVVDDIADVLDVTNPQALLDRYYHERRGSDPVVHFYETFLAHYDPEEREQRGVYYTPEPVVNFIVRSIHRLLRERFARPDGLAASDVTLLDPAAGTMTFIAAAAVQAVRYFQNTYGEGATDAFVATHILRNFFAFELMMAPYAVGHLKMAFF